MIANKINTPLINALQVSRILKILVCSILCLFSYDNASAQRTMPNQGSLCIPISWNGTSFGAGALYSRYLSSGYWETGVIANRHLAPTTASVDIEYYRVTVCGGYMQRIAANRRRSFNLYLGGGMFLGVESRDPFSIIPENIEISLAPNAFTFGVYPNLLAEIFISKGVAITLSGSLPIIFSSAFGVINYNTALGLKFMI